MVTEGQDNEQMGQDDTLVTGAVSE